MERERTYITRADAVLEGGENVFGPASMFG